MPRPRFWAPALSALLFAAPARPQPPAVGFRTGVVSALRRAGCNRGACHGSPQGKNGFRLSLRGHDPDLDLLTLARGEMGRRIDPLRPENSLFLLKGTGRVPHQGGVVLRHDDPAYRVLLRWVAEGCRDAGPSPLARLEVTPDRLRLPGANPAVQLTARAHFRS